VEYRDLFLARHGGVVTTAEFYRNGDTQSILFWRVLYGSLIRVRRGLYCDPGLPDEAIRALRVGGRLACASALAYHGGSAAPPLLHVSVPGNSPVLRDPDTGKPGRSPEKTVIHWSRRRLAGDRVAVSVAEAHRQAERCRALARDTL
jgi:hypothetical protein